MLTKELQNICTEYYRRLKRAKAVVQLDDCRLTDLESLAQKLLRKQNKTILNSPSQKFVLFKHIFISG